MANFSSTQVMKKFLEEDSPVKPGSSLIVAGQSGDLKASATDLLAVKKTLPEGNIEYAAACLGLRPSGIAATPWTNDAVPAKVA